MSLRTKILATVVGLNLLVLLLGVSVLLFLPPSPGVPSELVALLSRVAADPRARGEGVDARLRAVRALRVNGPGVLTVTLLREQADDLKTPELVDDRGVNPPPSPEEVARAVGLHRKARKEGAAQVTDGEIALVLEGPVFTDDPLEPVKGRFEGVYVRWSPARADLSRVRSLYFTLLAGIVVVTATAWVVISRLVVRPLASLAAAADRAASGDLTARVPASGAGDEFDRTAEAFNRMAAEVSEHHEQLQDRVLQAIERSRKAERHLVIAQRLAATGKLAAGIAHEINNPLGGMRNAVRSLARGELDASKTAEYLDLVQDGLARIEDTVKKVLLFTPRTAQPRATDLVDVAKKAVALARHRLERHGVRIEERYPAAGPVRLFGDPNELQQVALNLVLNAGDAISEKGDDAGTGAPDRGVVRIAVTMEGDAAILEVADDGVGMTPEVQAQCFDFFFTTKAPGEGTGVGLAVVHNVVTNHGGRIELSSEVGRGTTFRVVLPLESSPSDAPTPAAPAGAP